MDRSRQVQTVLDRIARDSCTKLICIYQKFFGRLKEFSVRRRYSDFAWLRSEIEKAVQINVPTLPPKAYFKQLPFMNQDDGIFESDFIEDRRMGLEEFINNIAGHPLVQNEKSLHVFFFEEIVDKNGFVPGKVGFQ